MQSVRELMRRKAYRTFFLSFVGVFCLPMLALGALGGQVAARTAREAEMSQGLVLEQFIRGIDGQLYTVMRLGDAMLVDDKALFFAERADPMGTLSNITSFQMLRSLTQEVGVMPMAYGGIAQCYLYLPRSGKVISNTITDASDFFIRRTGDAFEDLSAWQAFLAAQPDGFFARGGATHYLRTLRRGDTPLMTVLIELGASSFDAYHAIYDAQSSMEAAIFSREGGLLFHTGAAVPQVEAAMWGADSGAGVFPYGGSRTRTHWRRSADTGCLYVTYLPEAVYLRPLYTLHLSMALGAMLMLGGGIALSLLLAKRQYRPILALRSFIGESAKNAAEAHGDDFEYLLEMLEAMDAENKSAALAMRSSRAQVERFALERLLKGMYASPTAMEEQLLSLNIALEGDAFAVAGIRADAFDATSQELRLEDRQLIRFVIANVFEELLTEQNARSAVSDGVVWLILSVQGAEDAWRTYLRERLEEGRALMRDRLSIVLSIAVSPLAPGITGIHRGYRAALQSLRRAEGARGQLILMESAGGQKQKEPPSNAATAQRLAQAVIGGDEAGMRAILHQAHDALGGLSHPMARLGWHALLAELMPLLSGYDAGAWRDIEARVHAIVEGPPLQDDFQAVEALCVFLCALPRMASPDGARGADIARRADAYIRENHTDSGLNITQVADFLGLTASYASALYKQQTGRSMLDTIGRIRVDAAKALLRETGRTSEEIAMEVGYYSTSTFLRAFKKIEGITPGQYRALWEKGAYRP